MKILFSAPENAFGGFYGLIRSELRERGISGQLELYPFDIRKFLVWVAPESFQKKIRSLYDQTAKSEQRQKNSSTKPKPVWRNSSKRR